MTASDPLRTWRAIMNVALDQAEETMMGYWTGHRLRAPQGGQAQGPTGAQRLPFASEWVDWNVAVPSNRSVTAIRQSGVVEVR